MSVRSETEAAYRLYITAYPAALWRYFDRGEPIDYARLDFWRFPMLFLTNANPGVHIAIVDRALFDRQVRTRYEAYVASGWAGGIQADRIEVHEIGPTLALIETEGTRFHRDGGVLNTWVSCYWMRRTTDGWRHVAVTDITPPRPSRDDWTRWLTNLLAA